MTVTQLRFPIDLNTYQPLQLDPSNSTLTVDQQEKLRANIQPLNQ